MLNLFLVIGLLPILNSGTIQLPCYPLSISQKTGTLLKLPDKLLEVTFGSVRCLAIGIYSIFLSNHYVQMCCIAELESLVRIETIILETILKYCGISIKEFIGKRFIYLIYIWDEVLISVIDLFPPKFLFIYRVVFRTYFRIFFWTVVNSDNHLYSVQFIRKMKALEEKHSFA